MHHFNPCTISSLPTRSAHVMCERATVMWPGPYVPLHRRAIDCSPFSAELGRDASRAVEGKRGVERVDAMRKCHLLGGGSARTVGAARAAQTQHVRLRMQWNVGSLTLDERHALLLRAGRGQSAL